MKRFINVWNRTSLIKRIIIGVILGFILGMTLPKVSAIGILGDLFVGGLKAVAPLLVFVLVASALSQNEKGQKTNMSTIIGLYLVGTLAAALVAVVVNYFFPITLTLDTATQPKLSSPEGVGQVFQSLLLQMVDNPINALGTANYIGVLTWAVIFGLAFRNSNKETKELLQTIADVTSQVVRWIINLAPFGILGLVFKTISDNGVKILANYGFLILALVGTMLFVALVINPFIAFLFMRKNPYPLVFRCLKDSGLTAFFTRSSAANIPVNMKLCEELGLNKDTYKVSIPLGATINMGGAAITISVLTLAAVNTLGIHVDFPTAFLLSVLSAVSACGASGVTGGSLLLVPVACSLFGISNDLAMQVVGVGFIVGVVQDSCETALNSSTDVLFTAVAEKSVWGKKKKVN
ncbi:sodium:dicarboxylate symporter family protein [Streptococcus infantarius subsp. infantarius]|uniref:serine/threonine transporter SstT n=1 Tax=Streptococcus infantarius TaxID=102684 RepID=UPI001BDB4945|nr:serine/threonine transporter SstT [Streptococcus infantarius]MBT0931618.1 serine/threonine transporter SstT [Streptococcus infantarius subsp. infantarius]MCO4487582.1 sodium:dicarboxylate symporter family protein [Streptococcus infantarius subsp. infantarius]MCO4489481.1 sodium:dicarboxylate symporter family protein [Streptococcus infantarius subsp. infantarius]MCO4491456.1 sodium:dicarboxylate symporter family protein [Streptococcus infantarius subsp. infantarius]MCO4507533.1 sodium:dicarb